MLRPLLAVLALAGACSSASSDEATDTTQAIPTNPGEEQPDFENIPTDILADLPGQLAIVDGGSVIVTRPNGSEPQLIDGGGFTTAYQPIWSPSGDKLGWITLTDSEALVKETALEGDQTNETSLGVMIPIYLQWNAAGETLTYLRQNPSGDRLEVGNVTPGEAPERVGVAQPYYYSLSPEGDSILAHIDGRQLVLWSEGTSEVIAETQGTFTAPAWLGSDHVVAHIDGALVSIDLDDKSSEEIVGLPGNTEFVVGPGGAFIAYLAGPPDLMQVQLDDEPATSSLRVVDVETGREHVVTDLPVGAFEWSLDGSLLAWLEFPAGPAVGESRWHFWAGAEVGVSSWYVPSAEMSNEYLPYFAQYAQSHSGWSSGGEAFAFAGAVEGEAGVWVQLMDPTEDPIRVGFGSVVFWSPDGAVAPSGVSPA